VTGSHGSGGWTTPTQVENSGGARFSPFSVASNNNDDDDDDGNNSSVGEQKGEKKLRRMRLAVFMQVVGNAVCSPATQCTETLEVFGKCPLIPRWV
jgi:hypothetical protein